MVGGAGAEDAIEIYGSSGAERIQDRGRGRHCRAKDHGDEQADDAMRQMLKHKRDENIIGILALRISTGLLEDFPRFIANPAGARIELLKFCSGRLRAGALE